jgi:hypothetical protein
MDARQKLIIVSVGGFAGKEIHGRWILAVHPAPGPIPQWTGSAQNHGLIYSAGSKAPGRSQPCRSGSNSLLQKALRLKSRSWPGEWQTKTLSKSKSAR